MISSVRDHTLNPSTYQKQNQDRRVQDPVRNQEPWVQVAVRAPMRLEQTS